MVCLSNHEGGDTVAATSSFDKLRMRSGRGLSSFFPAHGVVPAQAGLHPFQEAVDRMDPRLRGDDVVVVS